MEQYIESLYNKERLDFKFKVLEQVTAPSILNQTYKNYTWLIYTSNNLPQDYKDRLNIITKNNKNAVIRFVDKMSEMAPDINTLTNSFTDYSTTRLDDDDWLCPTFLKEVSKYSDKKGIAITFPNILNYSIDNNNNISTKKRRYPYCSAGYTSIQCDIYTLGPHALIHKRHPVIIDKLKNAVMMCCSDFCDTKRKFK